ncbi:arsenate reductase family protein [Phycisphaerales bacterium AB-hyl4]|uniref:Arsenate reductase family protein n=1 Tax=Natronomicrosphaera hydrolytica TaxID=3242702 RepID=A0ABV4U9B5_9BACT
MKSFALKTTLITMLTFYGYARCSTCRNARKWLDDHNQPHTFIDITETPPPKELLLRIARSGAYQLRHLFNTSGQVYRELNVKSRLPDMSEDQAIDLLASHGKLIKRPIVVNAAGDRFTVGYKADVFERVWS